MKEEPNLKVELTAIPSPTIEVWWASFRLMKTMTCGAMVRVDGAEFPAQFTSADEALEGARVAVIKAIRKERRAREWADKQTVKVVMITESDLRDENLDQS